MTALSPTQQQPSLPSRERFLESAGSNACPHPHAACRDGRRSVDEKFQQIDPRDGVFVCSAVPPAVSNQTRTPVPYQHGAHFYEDAGASSSRRYIDTVALFHYSTKSQADFAVKIQRGASSGGNPKSWEFFEQLSRYAAQSAASAEVLHIKLPWAPFIVALESLQSYGRSHPEFLWHAWGSQRDSHSRHSYVSWQRVTEPTYRYFQIGAD